MHQQTTTQNIFYCNLHNLLGTASGAMVILAGDMKARVGRLSSNVANLAGSFDLDSCRSENGKQLLASWSDHQFLLAGASFRRINRWYATWRLHSSSQR